ncbi:helix-turn-helix domain-containing protein [Streptomyces graminilatus]|uniref:nSTAND1 domain-containing NTPase n=1 Tax=Streptomyces graminilatus TaxID=1464070 RepID=UPI0006E16C6E|nr:helix-turn-helix domain-containing protein [Streptomyces graminilatus]
MARGESPLDPEGGPLFEFAARLRKLREQAGRPTYRDLARNAHYGIATLSSAAAGRQLPSLAVTLAYVRACGGDEREWKVIWQRTADACTGTDTSTETGAENRQGNSAKPPYVGLFAFGEADAGFFFGREKLTGALVEHLKEKRLLVLFGASGSGKSSVLRAGVLPAFPGVSPLVFTPGPHPLEECAVRLATRIGTDSGAVHASLAAEPHTFHRMVRQILAGQQETGSAADELLVVVDQFEEVFTVCRDAREREQFVAALLHAALAPDSRTRVAIAVRSDFYTHCTRLPGLVDALSHAHHPVGPMTAEELRAAIVQPAARSRLTVESALLTTLTADAHGRPGALPLLSHALLETWKRRRGNALTLAGYRAAGGFEDALSQTAEEFHQALSKSRQEAARQLFLRLVALGEGTEDTKRRVPRRELDGGPDTGFVLEQATKARLLTADGDHVEIAHEALIRCWPRLGGWLEKDRGQVRLHRALTEATTLWESLDHDPDTLYRGVRLAAAKALPPQELTARERAFLDAGESAVQRARQRDRRHLRRLAGTLAVLLACAATAAGFAVRAQNTRDEAVALRAADEAVRLSSDDPSLAVQIALAAYRQTPQKRTGDALVSALSVASVGRTPTGPEVIGRVPAGHTPAVPADGRTLAMADGSELVLWDMRNPRRPRRLGTTAGVGLGPIQFTRDGSTLLGVDSAGTLWLWDVTDPRNPRVLSKRSTEHTGDVFSVDVRHDGLVAATGSYDDTIRLWDIADPARPRLLDTLTGHTRNVKPVVFSPDGKTLASGSDDHDVRIWDVTDPRHAAPVAVLKGHRNFVDALAYSPDGRTLLSGSDDHTAKLWDISDLPRYRELGDLARHGDVVTSVAFASDGRTAATVGVDSAVNLWDVTDRARPSALAHLTNPRGTVKQVRYLKADGTFLTVTAYHSVQTWYTDLDRALTDACDHVHSTISRAQWARHFPHLDYAPPCPRRT